MQKKSQARLVQICCLDVAGCDLGSEIGKTEPPPLAMISGTRKIVTHLDNIAMDVALASCIGIASGHLAKRSMMAKM